MCLDRLGRGDTSVGMPFESGIKLYMFTNHTQEVPRVRTEHSVVVLHVDLDSPREGSSPDDVKKYWEDFAKRHFSSTYAIRFYVVDFSHIWHTEFLAEISTQAASKIVKPIVRVLTKLNVYDANLVAFAHTASIAVKLFLSSDLLCERFARVLLVSPTIPKKQTWYRLGNTMEKATLHLFADKEERLEFLASQDFVPSLFGQNVCKHSIQAGEKAEVDQRGQIAKWLSENLTDFDCELSCEQTYEADYDEEGNEIEDPRRDDVCRIYEVVFLLDKYSKQVTQRLLRH